MKTPATSGKFVCGEGPEDARVMLLGRNPGLEESRIGRNFVGRAGQELSQYLSNADLGPRSTFRIANAFRLFTEGDEPPTDEQFMSHWPILARELALVRPEVLVTFGADCTRHLFAHAGIKFRDMECHHGLPVRALLDLSEGLQQPCPAAFDAVADAWIRRLVIAAPGECELAIVLFPAVHPAAGLHKPMQMPVISSDFSALADYLRGDTRPVEISRPTTNSLILSTAKDVQRTFVKPSPVMGVDTEGLKDDPWGLTYCFYSHTGYCIKAKAAAALDEFRRQLAFYISRGGKLIIHNVLHDLDVLAAMQIHLPDGSYLDTMMMSYLLGIEPQGLKPLAWRHLNVEMDAYEDVVGPYSLQKALDYLRMAATLGCDNCSVCGASVDAHKPHPRGGYEDLRELMPEALRKDGTVRKKYAEFVDWCPGSGAKTDRRQNITKRIERALRDFGG